MKHFILLKIIKHAKERGDIYYFDRGLSYLKDHIKCGRLFIHFSKYSFIQELDNDCKAILEKIKIIENEIIK